MRESLYQQYIQNIKPCKKIIIKNVGRYIEYCFFAHCWYILEWRDRWAHINHEKWESRQSVGLDVVQNVCLRLPYRLCFQIDKGVICLKWPSVVHAYTSHIHSIAFCFFFCRLLKCQCCKFHVISPRNELLCSLSMMQLPGVNVSAFHIVK